jgi:hypothetical protein
VNFYLKYGGVTVQNIQFFSRTSFVKRLGLSCVTGLLLIFIAVSAYAHAAVLWCYVENDRVYVEAFFMGGKKVQDMKIFVVDKNGNKVLEGITDKQGLFDFAPPFQDDMTIVLKIDSGHGAEFQLTKQDFIDAAAESTAGK